MRRFKGIIINGKKVYEPQPKQEVFHNQIISRENNGIRYWLYGGAAKGGKSHALRFEAHRVALENPGIRILLIRSSFPELRRTHLSRVYRDLPSGIIQYNDQHHVAKYINGSVLEFGYGSKERDFEQYLSAEYDVILVDELTTIDFPLVVLLWSRLAASIDNFIPYFAGASNPGGKGHLEVKRAFITKNISTDIINDYNPNLYSFIPALVYDNQILLKRDKGILQRLEGLPDKQRQRFLYGNWDVYEGQFFDEFHYDVHVLPKSVWNKLDISSWRQGLGFDYGKRTAVIHGAKNPDGVVHITNEYYCENKTRPEVIKDIKEFITTHNYNYPLIADTFLWSPDGFDLQNPNTPAYDFLKAGITLVKASRRVLDNRRYRVLCNDTIKSLLHWEGENGIITKTPKLYIWDRCKNLIEQLPSLVVSDTDEDDIEDQPDDLYDAMKHLVMTLVTPPAVSEERILARRYLTTKKKLVKL